MRGGVGGGREGARWPCMHCGRLNRPQHRPRRWRPPPQLRHALMVPGLPLLLWPPLLLPLLLLSVRELAVRLVAERGDGGGAPPGPSTVNSAGWGRACPPSRSPRNPRRGERLGSLHGRLHGCWMSYGCMQCFGGAGDAGAHWAAHKQAHAGEVHKPGFQALQTWSGADPIGPSCPAGPVASQALQPPVNPPGWRPSRRRCWSGAPSTMTAG